MSSNTNIWESLLSTRPKTALLSSPSGYGLLTQAAKAASLVYERESVRVYQDACVQDVADFVSWTAWSPKDKLSIFASFKSTEAENRLGHILRSSADVGSVWLLDPSEQFVGSGYTYIFGPRTPEEMASFIAQYGDATYANFLMGTGGPEGVQRNTDILSRVQTVASWLKAVSDSNRGLLYEATFKWGPPHSQALAVELGQQVLGCTLIQGTQLNKIPKKRLEEARGLLLSCHDHKTTAIALGLGLMRN